MPKNLQSLIELQSVFHELSYRDNHTKEWVEGEFSRESWYADLREAKGYTATDTLRAEQLADRDFMLDARGFGLFSETGWGKTRTAISATPNVPVLVVTTKSTLYQWASEFQKIRPEWCVAVVEGTAAERNRLLSSESDVYIIGWANIASHSRLETYGSVSLSDKEKSPGLLNRHWCTVIFDEAHRLGDPHNKWTRAAWAIASDADYRYALTGTPLNGHPETLWGCIHTIRPDVWPVRSKFIDRYCLTGRNPWGGFEVYGFRTDNKPEFDRIYDSITSRRLLQLDRPSHVRRVVGMESRQRRAYDDMAKNLRIWLDNGEAVVADGPLAKTSKLFQLASHGLDRDGNPALPSTKVDALCDLVEELDGEPLLAFAVNRAVIELCAKSLQSKLKVTPLVVNGDTTPSERRAIVERFQTGKHPVILGTTALAEGVDGLQDVCRTGVFLQRPWSLILNRQILGRLQRVGQERPVLWYDIVSADSIDEHVWDTIVIKEENFEDVVRDRDKLSAILH